VVDTISRGFRPSERPQRTHTACFYDPAINRTYADMAAHYDTAVVPARPRRPKDKAKVEVAVLLAERWIVARLRNRRFFGLDELNAVIRPLLDQLNAKVTRHLGASRRDLELLSNLVFGRSSCGGLLLD
jgi:transposase